MKYMKLKTGRATARGARTKIQASQMADDIIENMESPNTPYTYTPCKDELLSAIHQTGIAYRVHKTVSAKRRLEKLKMLYHRLYGKS